MVTLASHEQDVLFTANRLLRDAMDGIPDLTQKPDTPRFSELSPHLHRQAAQHRNGRLRTIEALRRPSK